MESLYNLYHIATCLSVNYNIFCCCIHKGVMTCMQSNLSLFLQTFQKHLRKANSGFRDER